MKNVIYWSSMAVFHEKMASITTTSRQRKKRRIKIGRLQKWRWWREQWRGVEEGHIWWWPQQRWWCYGLPRFHLKEQSQENRKWLLLHRQYICCLTIISYFFTATWTCAPFVLHFSLLYFFYTSAYIFEERIEHVLVQDDDALCVRNLHKWIVFTIDVVWKWWLLNLLQYSQNLL